MTVQIRREVWRILAVIGVVVALAALLMAACGDRNAEDEAADAAVAPTTAPAAPTAPLAATEPTSTSAPPLEDSATTPTRGAAETPVEPGNVTATQTLTVAEVVEPVAVSATLSSGISASVSTAVSATASAAMTATVSTTSSLSVTVDLPVANAPACPIETSAELAGYPDLQERLGCPLAEASIEPIAINEFGDGPNYDRFMLWFGNEQQIYVLQPDGTWLAYTDSWSEKDPEIACNPDNLNPAESPPLPRRGFGKLWCTVESVRLAMGMIGREERLCQHAIVQRHEQGRLLACFEDATIRYFRLLDDGAWDMEVVQ